MPVRKPLNRHVLTLAAGLLALSLAPASAQSAMPPCPADQSARRHMCFGTQNLPDGERYVGEFRNGERHGRGTSTLADGERYIGEFRDGKRHGLGSFTTADGGRYVGHFRDDAFNGQGSIFSPTGQLLLNGIWRNNRLSQENNFPTPAVPR